MTSNAANHKRIAKNTLMLYVRMLFNMLVSLYTSRVVLSALGVEDYGIYNVVGGMVIMFSLISSSLSASVSRFLTFELGTGNQDKVNRIFSTALIIHIALAIIIWLCAETIGVWFLNNYMNIPGDRMYAANWVFQFSIISFMFGVVSVPYNASIISHERMKAFAYIGMVDVLLRLAAVLSIAYIAIWKDKLIIYSLFLVCISILLQSIYIIYCRTNFKECRFRRVIDKPLLKELTGFAGWNFIGSSAGLLKDQGVNILLNIFCGPVINAARGISFAINGAIASFAYNFMTAINPQITKSYAAGNHQYMMSLIERGSRFSFYILLFLALPFLIETDYILTLWLNSYPAEATLFVRLVLILSMIDVLSNTLITLQLATGKIRNYQIAVGGMMLMNFPVSYIVLKLGAIPQATLIVAIVISICCLSLRLIFLKQMTNLSIQQYISNVCINVLAVTACSIIIPAIIFTMLAPGLTRFFVVTLSCILSSSLMIYLVGCSLNERIFIQQKFAEFKHRFA